MSDRYSQSYTPDQMTKLIDEVRDQIAHLAQANADLLVYVNDHIKELKAQSDTTTLENGHEILTAEVSKLSTILGEINLREQSHYGVFSQRIKELSNEVALLREQGWDIQSGTAELEATEAPPEVTISHDMLANGTWRYKTSVTMQATGIAAVADTLSNVDQLARAEALRRTALDRDEAPLSRGLGKPKPEAIKTQLE